MSEEVGVIGVGKVGSRIVGSLRAGGYSVSVHDKAGVRPEIVEELELTVGESPAEVAERCDVVVLSLTNSAVVRAVVDGPDGLLSASSPPQVVMDTSTLSPHTAATLAAICAAREVYFLDSPITGGLVGAESGSLNMLIGGEEKAIELVEPVLSAVAVTWHHMGPSGSGQAAKLTHNLIGQSLVVLFTEAMVLGTNQGLSPEAVYQTLRNYTKVYDVCLDKFYDRGLSGDFSARFTLDTAHKDLTEMMEYAHSERLPLPATSLVREIHEMGRAMGLGTEDNTAILKVYEALVGREIRVTGE